MKNITNNYRVVRGELYQVRSGNGCKSCCLRSSPACLGLSCDIGTGKYLIETGMEMKRKHEVPNMGHIHIPASIRYERMMSEFMPHGMDRCNNLIDATLRAKFHEVIKGKFEVRIKSKTRYVSFEFKGRIITLVGRNKGYDISVSYSVYCDYIKDKRKLKTPKDAELSKKIALGRLDKSSIYTVKISDNPHRFIDTALDVVRTKILKGEIVIKGIRDEKPKTK